MESGSRDVRRAFVNTNYKVIAAPRAEMHAWIGDGGHDLDAIPEPRSAVSEVELCIASFDYCKVGDVRIVMMNFQ